MDSVLYQSYVDHAASAVALASLGALALAALYLGLDVILRLMGFKGFGD